LSLAAGCGGGGSNDEVPPAPAGGGANAGGPAFDMAKVNATVSGKISFEGTPPPNDKVQMSADPYCQMHASDYPTLETVKVSDGGLENVIVYISGNAPTGGFPVPAAMEINQENCHYIPHVFTLQTGQQLNVKNSDSTLHNIHAQGEKNAQFNVGQPVKGMVNNTTFKVPEVPLPIKCDVHKWMGAFVGVFDHPFATVSKQAGAFELKLPAGTYELTAWHEKFGKKTMMVTVADNDKKEVNFSFSANDKVAD
jgi:plastocyanin